MPLNYTDKAKRAVALASKESKRLKHSYVGTEHLLLGLLKEGDNVAGKVLMENGTKPEDIERLITDQIALYSEDALAERDGYTPKLTEILNGAQEVADSFKATEVGTEHILIALIKDMDNLAIRIINTLGINIQKLYLDTLMSMVEDPGEYKEELQNARF